MPQTPLSSPSSVRNGMHSQQLQSPPSVRYGMHSQQPLSTPSSFQQQSPPSSVRHQQLSPHSQSPSTTVRYGVYACRGCTNPFVALSVDDGLASPLLNDSAREDGGHDTSNVNGAQGRKDKPKFTSIPTESYDGHPVFQYHIDIIQWIDEMLELQHFAKEIVLDFTGEVQYKLQMLLWLLVCLLPMLLAMPILLSCFCIGATRKYGFAYELLPVYFATVIASLSYVSLFYLMLQKVVVSEVEIEISAVEIFMCPTVGVILCMALLVEIFLLRVENTAAIQVREQLLQGPQAEYSHAGDVGDTPGSEMNDLHGLLNLLRHMSRSLRERMDMMPVFQFSVIEQILCSDTRRLYHEPITAIVEKMSKAPKGPSPSHKLGRRGNEPLSLAWECYSKYKRVGLRHHMRELTAMLSISGSIAAAPSVLRWLAGDRPIPWDAGYAVSMLVITYMWISIGGISALLLLSAHGKHRFSHLKRCLVIILYISGTPRFRPALHARFYTILHDICLADEGTEIGEGAPILYIEEPVAHKEHFAIVECFADRFIKQRELTNVGDEKVSVSFPTLNVNKFFLLRCTIRSLVACERLRQQMNMLGIFFAMMASGATCALPMFVEHRNPNDHVVIGFALFCLCIIPLAVMLNDAVAMNNIMQSQSTATLKAWRMEIQEVHWTLQSLYRIYPVSEARLLLDNYFRGLLEPYRFMVNHIQESEKPMSFGGIEVTAAKRNQILGSVGSSGALFLLKMLTSTWGNPPGKSQ